MVQQQVHSELQIKQLLVRFSYRHSFTSGDATDATGTVSTVYTAGSAGSYSNGAAPGTIGLDHGLTVTGTTQGAGTRLHCQQKLLLLIEVK